MANLRRGIAPELLLSQVKNTMPYLFEEAVSESPLGDFVPAHILREFAATTPAELSHFEYFRLCLSAHYLTCATPVPTDVDRQIRHTLWPSQLSLEEALQMADLVLASRKWDFTQVSTRFVHGAPDTLWGREPLSGHLGEWFTVSSGAYCALKQYRSPRAQTKRDELLDNIADEVTRHSEIFGSLWKANDGITCLKASASIAHNFGDLDRVMDMWELPVDDPLRLNYYKLAMSPFDTNRKLRYLGRLWVAGELYKSAIDGSAMALENHRHFALRKPKCLRKSPAFLIPTGPFFDDWAKQVARGLATPEGVPSEETHEVIAALKHGWERMEKTVAYGRALNVIQKTHSSLRIEGLRRDPRAEIPQERFEKKWNDEALRLMDDIPSRA